MSNALDERKPEMWSSVKNNMSNDRVHGLGRLETGTWNGLPFPARPRLLLFSSLDSGRTQTTVC